MRIDVAGAIDDVHPRQSLSWNKNFVFAFYATERNKRCLCDEIDEYKIVE